MRDSFQTNRRVIPNKELPTIASLDLTRPVISRYLVEYIIGMHAEYSIGIMVLVDSLSCMSMLGLDETRASSELRFDLDRV